MREFLTIEVLIFFICSLVAVVLHILRTITTVKGSVLAGAIMNMVAFGFYTLVLKQISNSPLYISVPLIMITNFIGMYIANWILKKCSKDKLWRISATIKYQEMKNSLFIEDELKKYNIKYNIAYPITDKIIIDIFSYTQNESVLIKGILKDCKYHVIEIDKNL